MSAHEREKKQKERKKTIWWISNTNAYYIYNHYAYCMLKCLLYNYVYYIYKVKRVRMLLDKKTDELMGQIIFGPAIKPNT